MPVKVPSNISKAAKYMCVRSLQEAGGASAIAKKLGWPRQDIHASFYLGYIPPKRLYDVVTLLEVTPSLFSSSSAFGPHSSSSSSLDS